MSATDPESDVDTRQLQREHKDSPPAPRIPGPAVVPNAMLAEDRMFPSTNRVETTQEEPSAEFLSELSFVCVLIPRFRDHHLVGDICEDLVEWMKQISISYGWRLDAIAVRPGYLQWVMSVPLDANPAHFMKIFRQHTSQKIFNDFPRFKQKNLSGQFWAPGNFVVASNQLQTSEAVNEYILQTRRHQGLV